MEQHPVPQNISSFEFKLFGNLTIRQFLTLLVPVAIAAAIFFSNLTPIIRIPLASVVGIMGFVIALVPFNGRPFDKWIVAFIKAISAPTQRIWVKEKKLPEFLNVVISPPPTEEKIPEEITAQGRERLFAYLRSLPRASASPLDVKEELAIEKLGLEPQIQVQGSLPPTIIWTPQQASLPQLGTTQAQTTEFQGDLTNALPQMESKAPISIPRISPHAKPFALPGIEKKLNPKLLSNIDLIKPNVHLASEANPLVENVIPIRTSKNQVTLIQGIGRTRVRKLHFAPPADFDLSKLAIRGEKRFEVSNELKKRFNFEEESTPGLQEEVKTASTANQIQNTAVPEPEEELKTVSQAPKVGFFIPKPLAHTKSPDDVSLKTPKTNPAQSKITVTGQKSTNVPLPTSHLQKAQIIPLTNKPNVLSGLITDSNGIPTEAAVLIVRDQNGIPVRALKTNKLGQFLSATPLVSGTYTIEIESELAKFEPQTINLEGTVLQPLEIKAQRN